MFFWLLLHIHFLPSIQQHLFQCFGRSPFQLRPSTSPSASTTRAGHRFAAFCSQPLVHAVSLAVHPHFPLHTHVWIGSRAATFFRSGNGRLEQSALVVNRAAITGERKLSEGRPRLSDLNDWITRDLTRAASVVGRALQKFYGLIAFLLIPFCILILEKTICVRFFSPKEF